MAFHELKKYRIQHSLESIPIARMMDVKIEERLTTGETVTYPQHVIMSQIMYLAGYRDWDSVTKILASLEIKGYEFSYVNIYKYFTALISTKVKL